MISFDLIEKLTAASDAQPVTVSPDACLNARHKDRHCDLCRACPTDAIHLDDTRVVLDESRCVECGLCAAVCPTRVFTTSGVSDRAILSAVATYAHIEFACKRATETHAPDVEGVMSIACLARLSPDLLVALAADHESVWLNDSPCAACPIGKRTHPQIVALTQAAEQLLAAWKRGNILRRYTDAGTELIERRPITRIAQQVEALSRRELFSFLRGNVGRAAGIVVAASMGKLPKAQASAEATPLERALTKLGQPQSEYVAHERFATIEIAASCTACGVCAKICPTNALEFRSDGGYFVLAFHARDCLGVECRLCQLICPVNAINLTPGVPAYALTANAAQTLQTGALTVCNKCYTPFATQLGELLCPVCRTAEAKRNALLNNLFKKNPATDRPTQNP